jgi:FkbM family methyltransferase
MNSNSPILHDFRRGDVSNAGFFAFFGMKLLALGARMTKPISYVGYSWIARLIRRVLPSRKMVVTQLMDDTKFTYPYADLYWSRLASPGLVYAPDMENFLRQVAHVDYAMIDCGANYGYVSSIVTSREFGQKPSIAIEADPVTFTRLKENAILNDNRFEIRHNAVFSKSGEIVNIYGDKHEARSIIPEDNQEAVHGNVETIVIDEVWDWIRQQHKTATILKLDVEGVEVEAMKGATRVLEMDCLVFYEDHGSDSSHEISRFMHEELGLKLFYPDKQGVCHEVDSIEQIASYKQNPRLGYDFLATKSPMWIEEVRKLVR